MTQRRLRQANLFGPAGFVSADDGEVIELVAARLRAEALPPNAGRTRRARGRRHRPHGDRDADPRHVRVLAQGHGGLTMEPSEPTRLRRTRHDHALRRLRQRRGLRPVGPVARVLHRGLHLPAASARELRTRLPARHLSFESKGMLKDRVYGIRETLFHDPYYQRHVVGAPRDPGRRTRDRFEMRGQLRGVPHQAVRGCRPSSTSAATSTPSCGRRTD